MAKRTGEISESFADRIGRTVRRVEAKPYSDGTGIAVQSDRADEFGIFEVMDAAVLDGFEWTSTGRWVTFDEDLTQYARNDDLDAVTLYFPTANRNASGEADGHADARVGQWVLAVFRGRWEVLDSAGDVWEFGKLDADLDAGSSAEMSIWRWNGSAIADTGDNVTVYDWLMPDGETIASGEKIHIKWHWNARKWYTITATTGAVRRFELKTALTPGGSATAYLLPWTGAAYVEDTGEEFTVYDALTRFRGLAKGSSDGSQGYAKFFGDRGVWEIQSMQPHALMIRCLSAEAVITTDASFDVDTVTVMQPTGGILITAVTLVYNIFSWDIDNDAIVVAVWNEATDHWEAIQVECPA